MSGYRSSRPLVEVDPTERLSADDRASQAEAEFLADALLSRQALARKAPAVERGVCANCGETCLPRAVYCDADCRADHELRLAAEARAGRPD